jgi:hypothetical protein
MATKKPWYTSKTLWFNAFVASMAALEASTGALQGQVPTSVYMLIAVLVPGINVALRFVTSQGIAFAKDTTDESPNP